MKIIEEVKKTLKALNYAILNGINKKRLPLKATFLRSGRDARKNDLNDYISVH